MQYNKMFAAVLATILASLVGAFTDGGISTVEIINVVVIGAGAANIFAAKNVPGAKYTKAILAVITAVAVLLVSVVSGGIVTSEWLQLGVTALGALGVYQIPNKDTNALP